MAEKGREKEVKTDDKDYDAFRSMLAEGFHTAFRKAVDSDEAWQVWKLISKMPAGDWAEIISFVADPTWEELQREK